MKEIRLYAYKSNRKNSKNKLLKEIHIFNTLDFKNIKNTFNDYDLMYFREAIKKENEYNIFKIVYMNKYTRNEYMDRKVFTYDEIFYESKLLYSKEQAIKEILNAINVLNQIKGDCILGALYRDNNIYNNVLNSFDKLFEGLYWISHRRKYIEKRENKWKLLLKMKF